MEISTGAKNAMLDGTGLKEQFDGAFVYVFGDPTGLGMPGVDEAAPAAYTILAKLSADTPAEADGSTGLTMDSPAGGVVAVSDVLQAILDFAGTTTTSPQAAVFARISAESAADVRTASTSAARLQLTAGGPSAVSEMTFGQDDFTDNGTNEIRIDYMQFLFA